MNTMPIEMVINGETYVKKSDIQKLLDAQFEAGVRTTTENLRHFLETRSKETKVIKKEIKQLPKGTFSQELKNSVVAMSIAGIKRAEIAKKFGLSLIQVQNILQREKNKNNHLYTDLTAEKAREMFKDEFEKSPDLVAAEENHYDIWRKYISGLTKKIVKMNSKYKSEAGVLTKAYSKMTGTYGIVFEQERKEFKEQNSGAVPEDNLELIYWMELKNKCTKNLLGSILYDMAEN